MRYTSMNDENKSSNLMEPTSRITRARAKALRSMGGLPPLNPSSKQDDKMMQVHLKRVAPDNKKSATSLSGYPQQKKRAVLMDVTNFTNENFNIHCIKTTKYQLSTRDKESSFRKHGRGISASFANISHAQSDKRKVMKFLETTSTVKSVSVEPSEVVRDRRSHSEGLISTKQNLRQRILRLNPPNTEDTNLRKRQDNLFDGGVVDIDSKHKDLQMCSLYAVDIYRHLHVAEFDRRPLVDYMEKLQRDITQGMRGILIDWLVEVSEEYKLAPDTLYLTVNLIDRYLSENYIEKQKLQLLGVTCMLIASKYEEICAPRVEDFCFITDNTYTKEEVVKMESHVLNFLGFRISIPTTKKFLRRFIQAAQVFYAVPSVELESLANFLAELTLIEYSFLKFVPSLTAASAVFLARWTLDQSDHPWNPTLEHYTRYKTSELQSPVLQMEELLNNSNGCMLNAIREKYKQNKFKCVSTLRSSKLVQSIFP